MGAKYSRHTAYTHNYMKRSDCRRKYIETNESSDRMNKTRRAMGEKMLNNSNVIITTTTTVEEEERRTVTKR